MGACIRLLGLILSYRISYRNTMVNISNVKKKCQTRIKRLL